MNVEDFEAGLRAADPAKSVAPLDADARSALHDSAVNGEAAVVIPISAWTGRRKAALSGAAAVLIGGLSLSMMQGANVADRAQQRIVFGGASQTNPLSGAAADKSYSKVASTSGIANGAMIWGGGFHYLFDDSIGTDGYTATGYEVAAPANVEAFIQRMAAGFGVTVHDKVDAPGTANNAGTVAVTTWTNTNDSSITTTPQQFYATVMGGNAYASFYDSEADPFNQCIDTKAQESKPDCTLVAPQHLGTAAQAIAAAREMLSSWGLDTGAYRFESQDQTMAMGSTTDLELWSRTVSATLVVDGMDAPVSWYFSFGDNMAVSSVSGQIADVKPIGSFDALSPLQAVQRLSAHNDKTYAEMKKNYEAEQAKQPDAGASAGSPGVGTVEPSPADYALAPQNQVKVSSVKRTMVTAIAKDGRQLWLPGYTISGRMVGQDADGDFETVINVVDSQIDFESLYANYGGRFTGGVAY